MFLKLRWVHRVFALATCRTFNAAMCLTQLFGVNTCFLLKIVYVLSEVHRQLALCVQKLNEEVSRRWMVTLELKFSRELIENFWVV